MRWSSMSTQFLRAGGGQGNQLGAAVFRVRPADHLAVLLEFGDVPAEDRGADAEPLGKMRGPGFALPHEAQNALKRDSGVLPAQAGGGHAADRALEVEDLVDEFGCGVGSTAMMDTPLLFAQGNYSLKWLLWETNSCGDRAGSAALERTTRTDS